MQLIKNMQFRILMALSILGVIFGSCDSLIYDNLEDCPQGVYVKFYSMTPCAADSTFLGNVGKLSIFAFNEKGVLAMTHDEVNPNLTKDYEVLIPVTDGTYTFVTWAGLNDKFDVSSFTPGVTVREDVMMALKVANGKAAQLGLDKIYQGESRAVHLPDPAEYGTVYKHTTVNLQEVTNRVKVIIEVDHENVSQAWMPAAKDMMPVVNSANATMLIGGNIKRGESPIEYPARDTNLESKEYAEWNYTLLDLVTGVYNSFDVTYFNELSGEVESIFKDAPVDLIGAILTNTKPGAVSLECENDFEIRIKLYDRCADCGWTYFSCDIYVNDWIVHSYSTELGN